VPSKNFHKKPFDEGTLTKLQIFELYARGWLPVFLSLSNPSRREIHIFDFFAGPGSDSAGQPGSPLRILQQLRDYRQSPGWRRVKIHVHFFDADETKIRQLEENITTSHLRLPDITFEIRPLNFEQAFDESLDILGKPRAAKLVFIDQSGVDQVTADVFRALVSSPTCDFLFFISSSILHRFYEHPAIKLRITRPDDYYHVHRAAMDYYRSLLPPGHGYYLAPFSIKKAANIYGVIFGSAHPRGMDKFLQVAWKTDEISGEADYDINREDIRPGEPLLPFEEIRPTKVAAFEDELERLLRAGQLPNERDVMRICFNHGVKRQHAERVLIKLKKEGVINLNFRVPDINRLNSPRAIRMRA
jgi:three-Cys-motif partner protein